MITVIGATGTIGRNVTAFLEGWGADVAPRDFRLEGAEHVDARDPASLSAAVEASDNLFHVLGVQPTIGRGFTTHLDLFGPEHGDSSASRRQTSTYGS